MTEEILINKEEFLSKYLIKKINIFLENYKTIDLINNKKDLLLSFNKIFNIDIKYKKQTFNAKQLMSLIVYSQSKNYNIILNNLEKNINKEQLFLIFQLTIVDIMDNFINDKEKRENEIYNSFTINTYYNNKNIFFNNFFNEYYLNYLKAKDLNIYYNTSYFCLFNENSDENLILKLVTKNIKENYNLTKAMFLITMKNNPYLYYKKFYIKFLFNHFKKTEKELFNFIIPEYELKYLQESQYTIFKNYALFLNDKLLKEDYCFRSIINLGKLILSKEFEKINDDNNNRLIKEIFLKNFYIKIEKGQITSNHFNALERVSQVLKEIDIIHDLNNANYKKISEKIEAWVDKELLKDIPVNKEIKKEKNKI